MSAREAGLITALALAESVLLAPFCMPVALFGTPAGLSIAQGIVVSALLLIAITRRLVSKRNDGIRAQRIAALCCAALVFGAQVSIASALAPAGVDSMPRLHPALWLPAIFGTLLLIWRGGVIGQPGASPVQLGVRFQLSVLLLVLLTIATLFLPDVSVVGLIMLFFAAWLVAFPLAHLEETHRLERGRSVGQGRRWGMWIAASTTGAIVLTTVVISLATVTSLHALVAILLAILTFPVLLLVAIIPEWVFRTLGTRLEGVANQSPLGQLTAINAEGLTAAVPGREWLGYVLLVAVLLAALLLVLNSFSPYAGQKDVRNDLRQDGSGDIEDRRPRESLFERAASRLGLRAWLAQMTVRRLYARALHEAAKRGVRRPAAQAPNDFLPALQRAFPHAPEQARILTEAYNAAHYGEVPDTPAELARVKQAWEILRAQR
jgi:hypothetical protein